jgi:hypothetical protein
MFKGGEGIMDDLVLECADDDEGDEGGSCIDFRASRYSPARDE